MTQPETQINQTLMIWCGVVIAEIIVIAYLMGAPWLALSAGIMFWPAKAAMNWPITIENQTATAEEN